eukprot:SAG11_NODE_501_length_8895_cov_12.129832_9_plen_61_part_00
MTVDGSRRVGPATEGYCPFGNRKTGAKQVVEHDRTKFRSTGIPDIVRSSEINNHEPCRIL